MKTKLLILTLLIFGLEPLLVSYPHAAWAKAYFASQSEMLKNSQIIAVVDVKKVEKADAHGVSRTYSQKATADVEQVLKGSPGKQITMYGGEDFICAQCQFKPGKTLVFLNQDNNLLIGSNWHLSIRPIENGQLEWYARDHHSPLKLTKFDDVLKSIKAKLPKQVKLSPPLAKLNEAERLNDAATGEAAEPSASWQAYQAILPVAAQHLSELEYIAVMGKPGGRIYAAMLLCHAARQASEKAAVKTSTQPGARPVSQPAAQPNSQFNSQFNSQSISRPSAAAQKDALETLCYCNGSVVYLSGCKGFPTSIREIASKLSGEGKFMNLKLE